MWAFERQENSPTVDMLERLSKALNIDPAVLFRKDKDTAP